MAPSVPSTNGRPAVRAALRCVHRQLTALRVSSPHQTRVIRGERQAYTVRAPCSAKATRRATKSAPVGGGAEDRGPLVPAHHDVVEAAGRRFRTQCGRASKRAWRGVAKA